MPLPDFQQKIQRLINFIIKCTNKIVTIKTRTTVINSNIFIHLKKTFCAEKSGEKQLIFYLIIL